MSKRYVTIPSWGNDQYIPLGAYVRAWKRVRADVEAGRGDREYKGGFGAGPTCTAERGLREFRRGMHDRINRHMPERGKGRWWDTDRWWEMRRLADKLNSRAVVREQEVRLALGDKLAGRIREERLTNDTE